MYDHLLNVLNRCSSAKMERCPAERFQSRLHWMLALYFMRALSPPPQTQPNRQILDPVIRWALPVLHQ